MLSVPARLFAIALIATLCRVSALWPMPRSMTTGSTPLVLTHDFNIIIQVPGAPDDLKEAVTRTQSNIRNDKLQRLVVGRGSADRLAVSSAKQLRSLVLLLLPRSSGAQSISSEAILPLGSRREGYSLHIPSDGTSATLTASSTLGLFRGLTTFEQLWYTLDDSAATIYTLQAPVDIVDSPAFVSPLVINFWCDSGSLQI